MKKVLSAALCVVLTLSLSIPALAAEPVSEVETAADYLFQHGIMLGNQNGEMQLESGLTRAQLATVLTRLTGDLEHIQTDLTYYTSQCKFPDVPEWAKPYVGYCYVNGLMVGYDTGEFGADDGVTPAAACTVVLRYMDLSDVDWDYSTACQTALNVGLTTAETVKKAEVTRGDLAVMIYRALVDPEREAPAAENEDAVRIGSYKGSSLPAGERSSLIINNAGTGYTVASSDPSVLDVEQVADNWVAVAKAAGTAIITVTTTGGEKGSLTITVTTSSDPTPSPSTDQTVDLDANMEIREEIIALVNEVRVENGVPELAVNQSLMNAAQESASRHYTWHHNKEECLLVLAHGYPYGFGGNLTVFTGASEQTAAQTAVDNWLNSPGHFQTMIDPDGDCIGVGVERYEGVTYCFLYIGVPGSYNFYG